MLNQKKVLTVVEKRKKNEKNKRGCEYLSKFI
jgi:hypothetical protein